MQNFHQKDRDAFNASLHTTFYHEKGKGDITVGTEHRSVLIIHKGGVIMECIDCVNAASSRMMHSI